MPEKTLSDKQLNVYREVARIRMAWVVLFVILGLFAVGFIAFLYAALTGTGSNTVQAITGGIDLLLGWAVKMIVKYLFSNR